MTVSSLPRIAEAAELTAALRRSGALGMGRVAAVAVDKSFPTILSHIFKLRPTYEGDAGGAPQSLILKAGLPERPGGPWWGGKTEVEFYAQVASAMPAGLTPRCFDAQWEAGNGAWHLLLEDLSDSHVQATQWPLPPSFEQSESIVRTHARFKAVWWDDPRLGVSVGKWRDAESAEQGRQRLVGQFAQFGQLMGERLSSERRTFYDRLLDQAPRLFERYQAHRHMTIVQGDSHVWNCFLPKGGGTQDGRLFDWDAWRLDVGTDDLAYMMALHWYPDQRRAMETRLLDCFHDELLKCGVQGYDRRALQEDYRLSVLWQIMTPVWHMAVGIPPVIWWNNLERIHMAAANLGCRDLLD